MKKLPAVGGVGETDCYPNKTASRTSEDPLAFATFFCILTPPFLPGKLPPGSSPLQQSQPLLRRRLLRLPCSLLMAHILEGNSIPTGTCEASADSIVLKKEKQSSVNYIPPNTLRVSITCQGPR